MAFEALTIVVRAEWRRRLTSIIVLGVVIAIGGSVSVAAVLAAQRTVTLMDRFQQATDASTLSLAAPSPAEALALTTELRQLEGVAAADAMVTMFVSIEPNSAAQGPSLLAAGLAPLSPAGVERTVDRPLLRKGRLVDDERGDEITVSHRLLADAGLAVGDRVRVSVVGPDLQALAASVPVTIVGEHATSFDLFVFSPTPTVVLPAALSTRLFLTAATQPFPSSNVGVRTADGVESSAVLTRIVERIGDAQLLGDSTKRSAAQGFRWTAAVLLGLGIVAAAATAAASLVPLRVATAGVRRNGETLRGLGMTPHAQTLLGVLVVGPAAAVGVAVAIAVAPLVAVPLGGDRVALVDPDRGARLDGAALGAAGLALLALVLAVFVLSAAGELRAGRNAPQGQRSPAGRARRPDAGLYLRTVGAGVGGIAVLSTVLMLGASRQALFEHPRRYGAGFTGSYALDPAHADEQVATLRGDETIDAASLLIEARATVNGRAVTAQALEPVRGALDPWPVTRGVAPTGPGQLAVGVGLLDVLGAEIGEQVSIRIGESEEMAIIVGVPVVASPTIGDFGWAAWLSPPLASSLGLTRAAQPADSSSVLLVEATDATSVAVLSDDLQLTAQPPSAVLPFQLDYLSDLGYAPAIFAFTLATLAAVAVSHGLIAGLRLARHELLVLRCLGLSPNGVVRRVLTGSLRRAAIMVGAGLAGGWLLGRSTWPLVARELGVAAPTELPLPALLGVALAGLTLAVLVVMIPAVRLATQTVGGRLRVG